MQLLIDLATMAVMFPGGIPVTDLSLVRGDKIPLRVTLLDEGAPVTPSGARPALAVKTALGDETLVLAATNLEPVDDALGPAYVGSLSVNTTQLIEAMGSAASIDLIGEVVLIAGDGSQRTSSLIRVTVRQDIMPADVIPPDDVLDDWSELVADALAAQLPDALKDAGVELEAATGQSTLSSGDAADTWTIVGGYAFTWGDEILAGHLPDSCRLTSISTVYFFTDPALNQYCLRVWRLTDGAYSLLGTSTYVSNLTSGQTATWEFTPGVPLTRGDVIIIQVCEGTEMTPYALGMHAVLTPSVPGRGLVTEVANPPAVNGTMAPLMTVMVDYDNGITLGGIELATARQLDSLGRDVRQSSATAEAAARTAGQSTVTASTAADNAETSATAAANSATAAANALAAIPQVDSSGNMTLPGNITAAGGTFDGTVNANGGVRVPAPATASNALSMDAILRELARMDWVRLRGGYECVFSGPIEYLTRMMSLNQKHSGYASLSEAVLNNCLYRVVQLSPSSGVSFLGLVSAPWKMGGLLGTSKDTSRAGAVGWLIDNADAASVCLGTTGQGYSFETNKTSQCYAHPVHWNNSSSALWTDYRLPYYHSVNSSSAKDPCPGFQVTIYGKNYLGSQSSCLVRGTDYGREAENTQYIWALVPKVANLVVAMAPRDAENDHAYVMNRWELFVNGSYVMPMTAGFCGTGHTACVQETVKAHEVSSAVRVGLRMQGVLVNQGRLPGSETALNQLGAVIQDDVTARPVPVVEASALEVDAGGGEVALSISSPLNEAVYVLNDTMCGHDSTAVWCSQSAESTEAGGGEIVLTLAANESGEARQVWAFVGHHYAQAAVIKINQSA